jgi:hypothetical protein
MLSGRFNQGKWRVGAVWTGMLIVALLPAAAAAELLFRDDFSSRDLSNHSEFFRWGPGGIQAVGSASDRIEDVTGPHQRTVQALRFTYRGTVQEGASGDRAHFAEQRFVLTRNRSERRVRNDASQTAYQEVWIAYWLRVPHNYFHARGRANNNKGFVYLWKDRYEDRGSADEHVTPTANSIQWWPTGSNGASRVSVFSTRQRNGWGHMDQATRVASTRQAPGEHDRMGLAFLPHERGRWVRVVVGMRASDSTQAANGFTKIYLDGELAMEWTGLRGGANNRDQNGYDRGYLLGYANSGFEQTTSFYVTDFRVGTTPASVGLEIRGDRRPLPPMLMGD